MEDINEYVHSGILELYVYGALTEAESDEVSATLKQYPEIQEEVAQIENSLMQLSAAAAPYNPEQMISNIKQKLSRNEKVIPITRKKSSLVPYLGWAASLLFLIGLFVLFNRNNDLQNSVQALQAENAQMESQIADARNNAEKSRQLLAVLRDKNIIRVPLKGQPVAPKAYAIAYYNQTENKTYIDAKDLPEPPRGMVYQVWSLKMQPLTPVSIGLLDKFEEDENKIFELSNSNLSEGFGITLEPAGGSKTPTMEQLYTLGTVSPS